MIKQCILLLAISGLLYTAADAQTWRIARASHSGAADEARNGEDNFGLPYRVERRQDSTRAAKRRDTMPKKPSPYMHKMRVRKINNSPAK